MMDYFVSWDFNEIPNFSWKVIQKSSKPPTTIGDDLGI